MKNQTRAEESEIDLLKLAKALWRKAWAIILAAVLFGAVAFAYNSYYVMPTYQASALMYVNNSSISIGSTSVSISSGELSAAKSLVDTYLVILNTRTTLEKVIAEAKIPYSYEDLREMVTAGAVNNTEIFRITVTSTNPKEAEHIANTIAEVLPDKISDVVDGSSVRVVEYAVVPARKSTPNVTKNTMLAMAVGVVIACAIIILRELFDDLIRDEDYLTQNYETPILAVIPELRGGSGNSDYKYNYEYTYGAKQHQRAGGQK